MATNTNTIINFYLVLSSSLFRASFFACILQDKNNLIHTIIETDQDATVPCFYRDVVGVIFTVMYDSPMIKLVFTQRPQGMYKYL